MNRSPLRGMGTRSVERNGATWAHATPPRSPSLLPLFFLVRWRYLIAFSTPVADFFHSPGIAFSIWLRL